MMHPIEALERYWHYTAFRPLQEDIINAVLNGDDVFTLLPTGGGKSLCYQIPALIKDGVCIVVSPLIALMQDQVKDLKSKGIKAVAITSGISYNELDITLDNVIYGKYKFLYLSPERLQQPLVKERLQKMNINLIAVDEAHCISQWGHDFRPAYKQINVIRQLHPSVPCIALTATAKNNVISDIIDELDLVNPKLFKASFKRANIVYQVLHAEDKLYQLEQLLKNHRGSCIIYVRSRRNALHLFEYLSAKKFNCTYYHGGISNKEKSKRLQFWLNNQKRIMIATTAFGMGINKADVQSVIHYNLPESLESYYQEAGRAGRNNKTAYAIILKQTVDENLLRQQFLSVLPSFDFIKTVYAKLNSYFRISYGEGEFTTHQIDFKDFCTTYSFNPSLVYNSLLRLDSNGIITLNQRFNYKTKIQFLVSSKALFHYLETHLDFNLLIKTLLRTYGGIFDYETKVNLDLIVKKSNLKESQVISQLKQLKNEDIISFTIANTDAEITFLKPREDDRTINPIARIVKQQHQLKHQEVESVITYINNTKTCLQQQLLSYFGEEKTDPCGKCSVCQTVPSSSNNENNKELSTKIEKALAGGAMSSRALLERLQCNETILLTVLQQLLERKRITLTKANTYTLLS